MKGLIKLETLRNELPASLRPSNHEFRLLMSGAKHHVSHHRIDKLIAIAKQEFEAFEEDMNTLKLNYTPKPKSK